MKTAATWQPRQDERDQFLIDAAVAFRPWKLLSENWSLLHSAGRTDICSR
jgi:hypothetical protein